MSGADAGKGVIGADDVFVIIALPDGVNRGVLPQPFGQVDFETSGHQSNSILLKERSSFVIARRTALMRCITSFSAFSFSRVD